MEQNRSPKLEDNIDNGDIGDVTNNNTNYGKGDGDDEDGDDGASDDSDGDHVFFMVMVITMMVYDGDENLMPCPECVAWSGVRLSSRSGRCYANDTFRVLILKILSIS